jgi:branched-subunit amino acid aminotransferase/4-amino-4-deoxychorismate lyase
VGIGVCWVDGRLRPADDAAVSADDSAFAEGRGCYTSVRSRGGAPRFAAQHVRRLERGAHLLCLPKPDARALHHALTQLGRAAFGHGDGIVRLQLSRGGDGTLRVTGVPRELGVDRAPWRAITAPFPHPGAALPGGPKLTSRPLFAMAAEAARVAGADEALFFDATGRLVEGSRSNVVVRLRDGTLCTPPVERGAVAGVALEVMGAGLPTLRRRDLSRGALLEASAVIATNAVRGARALVSLDDAVLGADGPELAAELNALWEKA